VDGVVHYAKHDTCWGFGNIAVPAIRQDGNVVVPVQQDERLFVNDDKKRVNQFSAIVRA